MALIKDIEELSTDILAAACTPGSLYFNQFRFGYLGEVNALHNTDYPLLLLLPPTSTFEDPYKNDEMLTCVFHMFIPYEHLLDADGNPIREQDQTMGLERQFDLLHNQFVLTMNKLLTDNEHKYIMTGAWDIDRYSEVHNDRLVKLEITVRINKYSHCLDISRENYNPPREGE